DLMSIPFANVNVGRSSILGGMKGAAEVRVVKPLFTPRPSTPLAPANLLRQLLYGLTQKRNVKRQLARIDRIAARLHVRRERLDVLCGCLDRCERISQGVSAGTAIDDFRADDRQSRGRGLVGAFENSVIQSQFGVDALDDLERGEGVRAAFN